MRTIGDALPSNTSARRRSLKRNPDGWKQNIEHQNRIHGLEYRIRKGEIRPAKNPRVMEDCKCKMKCHELINSGQQTALLQSYKDLGDTARQKAYLSADDPKKQKCLRFVCSQLLYLHIIYVSL